MRPCPAAATTRARNTTHRAPAACGHAALRQDRGRYGQKDCLGPGASGPMWASAPTVGRTGGAWWGSNLVPGGYIIRPYRQACRFTVGRFFDSLRRPKGGTPLRHAARATSPQGEALASAVGKPPCTRGLANAPCAPLRAKRTYSLLFPITSSARSRALPGPGGGRRASGRGSRRCW